jgi:hypothetical protein
MEQAKNLKKMIWLTCIYTICIGSIVLAFPRNVWYSASNQQTAFVWSATNPGIWLPIDISWWQGEATESTKKTLSPPTQAIPKITPSVIQSKPQKPKNKAPIVTSKPIEQLPVAPKNGIQLSKKITCMEVQLCEKVSFSDWYDEKQKTLYYSTINETIYAINSALSANNKPTVSSMIGSISLYDGKSDRRGRGGSRTIIINTHDIVSLQEFREILTHEVAHIIDLGVLVWNSPVLDNTFAIGWKYIFTTDDPSLSFYRISRDTHTTRKANASFVDFVWGYAMSNPYEDFAESFNMYMWHQDVFVAMAQNSSMLQQKLHIIESLVGTSILWYDAKNTSQVRANNKWRPWDSTRMSLE